ncbi:hypothetical protein HN419_00115 [Candidatus Woesearchaeota archaeon]|nr:hypothetical protein [Candidatus Woesearchaeota archaeon]MBT3538449.1 hypothetical protein [Candidatus Woesearchaeota archaeon]MBT4697012.1 hypothetical protein [Candidatus Woesearchaeota archaeon]MBT7106095.1 hypothetical protein [Candidatus Woesearchaeota archaeon]MBT7931007.1 hypothetical protein [Candidatus Woesearchaeota archaeon]
MNLKYLITENYYKKIALLKFIFLGPKLKKEKYYRVLDEGELLKSKKSDTVVIFGCGYSINNIKKKEWKQLEKFDTMAFNNFYNCESIRIDYHVVREMTVYVRKNFEKSREMATYIRGISENVKYKNTTFLICKNMIAPYYLLNNRLLKKKSKIFLFENSHIKGFLSNKLGENFNSVSHKFTTLEESINIAYLMGYKKIILAGIDLYDSRYFWLKKDESFPPWTPNYSDSPQIENGTLIKGESCKEEHQTANVAIKIILEWLPTFKKKGVKMYVLNPKSLLNKVLDIWRFS